MIDLVRRLIKDLEEECNAITTSVLNGTCGSYETYKEQTGIFKAKKAMWERLQDLMKKAEADD